MIRWGLIFPSLGPVADDFMYYPLRTFLQGKGLGTVGSAEPLMLTSESWGRLFKH